MTVTMEALQHLLGEMHKMQSDSLANLMKQQNDALAVLVGSGPRELWAHVPSRSKVTS